MTGIPKGGPEVLQPSKARQGASLTWLRRTGVLCGSSEENLPQLRLTFWPKAGTSSLVLEAGTISLVLEERLKQITLLIILGRGVLN